MNGSGSTAGHGVAHRVCRSACVLLGLGWLAGCLSGGDPSGPPAAGELRFHNWWNYYERAEALLAAGNVESARQDFERALGLRAGAKYGYDRDTWRARTYGMHFVEQYFPNRELGVCLYLQGNVDEALPWLEKSCGQMPSGRARHYLNRVRRERLSRQPPALPRIEVSDRAAASWTRLRVRGVDGMAAGPGLVADLRVNGQRQFVEMAEASVPFSRELRLREGSNVVTIVATDLLGRSAERTLTWIADWRPPVLVVHAWTAAGDGWVLDATCRDDAALGAVTLGGEPVPLASRALARVRRRFAPGESPQLVVDDLAGNRLTQTLTPAAEALGARADGQQEAGNAWAAATGCALPFSAAGVRSDAMRPSLRLSARHALIKVFDEEFFLDGEAADAGGLAAVSVNGENQLKPEDAGAVSAHFGRRVALDPGTNRFEIEATDVTGNVMRKALTVVRCRAEYLDASFRLRVGIPPLRGGEPNGLAERVKRMLEDELLTEPPRFHLLERAEGWEYVLREQEISLSDLADPQAALRIGKIVPAEMLFLGAVLQHDKGLTIRVEVVDTATARPLIAEDVYCEDAADGLPYQVSGLVLKLESAFPLVSGEVTACSGPEAALNVGQEQGVRTGTKFIVLDDSTGGDAGDVRVCRLADRPVELSVEKVERSSSRAQIAPTTGAGRITKGCRVYAR